jgi:hypothetical protein
VESKGHKRNQFMDGVWLSSQLGAQPVSVAPHGMWLHCSCSSGAGLKLPALFLKHDSQQPLQQLFWVGVMQATLANSTAMPAQAYPSDHTHMLLELRFSITQQTPTAAVP